MTRETRPSSSILRHAPISGLSFLTREARSIGIGHSTGCLEGELLFGVVGCGVTFEGKFECSFGGFVKEWGEHSVNRFVREVVGFGVAVV